MIIVMIIGAIVTVSATTAVGVEEAADEEVVAPSSTTAEWPAEGVG